MATPALYSDYHQDQVDTFSPTECFRRPNHNGTYTYTPLALNQIRLITVLSCPSIVSPGRQLHVPSQHPIRSQNGEWPTEKQYQDGEMHIRISHADIQECQLRYTTLSYCWGDATKRRNVIVHDVSSTQVARLSVTESLYEALRRAQQALVQGVELAPNRVTISSFFWADAICIRQEWNENDPSEVEIWAGEKARQVYMMGQIYSSALSCLIDLGDDEKVKSRHSHMVFPFVLQLLSVFGQYYHDLTDFNAVQDQLPPSSYARPMETAEFWKYGLPPPEDNHWTAWTYFLARPWFRRVWVMQEWFLSRQGAFMYGSIGQTLPLDALSMIANNLRRLRIGETFRRHSRNVDMQIVAQARVAEQTLSNLGLWRVHQEIGESLSLVDGFKNVIGMNVTQDRDRVYALLGMCGPLNRSDPDLAIDYTGNVSDEEVFLRASRYILRHDPKAVDLLYCKNVAVTKPSWTPLWVANDHALSVMKQFRNGLQIYCAGGDGQCELSLDPETDTLTCKGMVVDDIAQLGPVLSGGDQQFLRWEKQTQTWLLQAHRRKTEQDQQQYRQHGLPITRPANKISSPEDMKIAYTRTLLGDNPPSWLKRLANDNASGSLHVEVDKILDKAREGLNQEVGVLITTLFPDTDSYERWEWFFRQLLNQITSILGGRRLCITKQGRLGLVPARARPGDVLVLLKGAVVPFAMRIRPRSPSKLQDPKCHNQSWELLGGSYVDGVMYGEAAAEIEDGFGLWSDICIE